MSQSKNKLIPGETLIYEQADGVVYARYAKKPEMERWIVGGDPAGVARAQGKLLDYGEWQNLCELAQTNATLQKQLKNLVNTYYMIKETK